MQMRTGWVDGHQCVAQLDGTLEHPHTVIEAGLFGRKQREVVHRRAVAPGDSNQVRVLGAIGQAVVGPIVTSGRDQGAGKLWISIHRPRH
ncbi:hypothetical protein ABZ345_36500 [Lentzea sp. NPDC005914]|uniref:hypothetical protein n=1 Tax=Lentzea sp. NPDC005914 TaxID=3154572 RepID=UPI0033DD2A60